MSLSLICFFFMFNEKYNYRDIDRVRSGLGDKFVALIQISSSLFFGVSFAFSLRSDYDLDLNFETLNACSIDF